MATNDPFPLMPSKSTELRLMAFDPYVYTATPSTYLYKFVDVLCGSSGAGALVNEIFLARLSNALQTIYFNDLDYIFGNINFLARSPAESYSYSPMQDMLTAAQWNEVRVKDNWYRARIADFFKACGMGGTPDGIRMAVLAALAVDCNIYEVWRYVDNFGITESLGRGPDGSARNEVVVQPLKGSLEPAELRLVRDMLTKIVPMETIVTVSLQGLAVSSPVIVNAAASDSEYYEVQKMVTASPAMANLPAAEQLPITLNPTEQWLYNAQGTPTQAPTTAFNVSSEYAYYYLVGGGNRSQIDSVTYGTINPNAPIIVTVYEMIGSSRIGGNTSTTPPSSWLANQLDLKSFRYVAAPYSLDTYPPATAISAAVTTLEGLINTTGGPFILVGYGLGAHIISDVYDDLRTGSMTAQLNNFLGGFAFGNPRRQAGITFPNCPEISGEGLDANNLLANCGSNWWEFAIPGDIAATNDPTTNQGAQLAQVFEHLLTSFTGDIVATITAMIGAALNLPSAQLLIQQQLDLFYGPYDSNAPHFQYDSYRPVPGDARSAVGIAMGQIASMSVSNLAALEQAVAGQPLPVICYEVGEVASPSSPTFIQSNLDSAIRYVYVPYPAVGTLPLQSAINTGVANLTTFINQNPGKFMLVGTGEGAIVTSLVSEQITGEGGTLASRASDYLAGVAFGNPRRKSGAIWPGGSDPGGEGIWASNLMVSVPEQWWEFANAGDPLCTNTTDAAGVLNSQIFEATIASYDGTTNSITSRFSGTVSSNVAPILQLLINVMWNLGTLTSHAKYGILAVLEGHPNTSYQQAVNYLNSFAGQTIAAPVPTIDPMDTYQSAANYQTFATNGQYTAPTPYALADSPDNYPGGKYGIHALVAPALNPDGTAYNFPYVSQTAYVNAMIEQVLAQGGLANANTYQLPLSPSSSVAQVFYPQYAIAYSPPVRDSTVSTSITARHSNPANAASAEIRDPINFSRSS